MAELKEVFEKTENKMKKSVGHLHAHVHHFLDGLADFQHGVEIDAVAGLARQGLAAEL